MKTEDERRKQEREGRRAQQRPTLYDAKDESRALDRRGDYALAAGVGLENLSEKFFD